MTVFKMFTSNSPDEIETQLNEWLTMLRMEDGAGSATVTVQSMAQSEDENYIHLSVAAGVSY